LHDSLKTGIIFRITINKLMFVMVKWDRTSHTFTSPVRGKMNCICCIPELYNRKVSHTFFVTGVASRCDCLTDLRRGIGSFESNR